MDTLALAISFVEEHRYLGYLVLFVGMIVEGEIVLMTAGILVNLDAFSLKEVFFIAYLGVIANDIIWYQIGLFLKNKYGHHGLIIRAEKKVKKILPNIENSPAAAIFVSKFIAGINHPTLVVLGFLKTNFKYFLKLQVFASFVWTLVFLSLGFLFGFTAISVSRKIHNFIIAVILLMAAVLIIERSLRYIFKLNGNNQ